MKGAETWAQTGHGSGGRVESDLVHAATFGCVTPACIGLDATTSSSKIHRHSVRVGILHFRHINKYITLDL